MSKQYSKEKEARSYYCKKTRSNSERDFFQNRRFHYNDKEMVIR